MVNERRDLFAWQCTRTSPLCSANTTDEMGDWSLGLSALPLCMQGCAWGCAWWYGIAWWWVHVAMRWEVLAMGWWLSG